MEECVHRINLAEDWDQWRHLLNNVSILLVKR
jgi:hypothetical protein